MLVAINSALISAQVLTGAYNTSHMGLFLLDIFERPLAADSILITGDNEGRVVPVVFIKVFKGAIRWYRMSVWSSG